MLRSLFSALALIATVSLAQNVGIVTNVESPSDGSSFDKYPSIVFDRQGAKWLAWTSTRDGGDRIVVRGPGGEERIDRGEGFESGARLILDGDGDLWAVWHGRRRNEWAVYARERRGGRWGAEQRIGRGLHPAVTRDARGVLWIAYEVPKPGGFAIELVARQGRRWSAPRRIESEGSDRRPALAPAADRGVWLAWDSTRSGNYDIWLMHVAARGLRGAVSREIQITSDRTIDDSPSIAATSDGTLWIAWNGMRGHADARYRADRHSGDAFARVYRNRALLAPPGVTPGALPGQVSFGAVNKTPRDAVDPYWHWKQTQNYPIVFVDTRDRAWIVWRTDATGAHNFDLWGRVHDGSRWSSELHLTTFSPGRDEFPSAAVAPDGTVHLAWEGQLLPRPGQEMQPGDVDLYNTLGMPNVVLTAQVALPAEGWEPAPLAPAPEEKVRAEDLEPMTPGPPPRTTTTADGRWNIYFGDPHSHTILSDGKTGLPDQIPALSRDFLGLDFAVVSDHSEMGHLQPSEYAELQLTAALFDQPGRFVSLTGWEWTAGVRYGHRVILYRDQGGTPISAAHLEGDTIEKLYEKVRREHGVMSPHHTGNATWGRWNPDAPHDEELEPNFEICSWHGRYEFYGNPWEGRRQVPGHQYQDALRRGRHVGVMGASDTHHLSPGEGGLTAVLAERLDRASIFDAIRGRRNYATTGARIVLEFTAGGAPMGSRIRHAGPLEMRVRVEGTSPIDRVEIVRNLVDTFAAVRIEQNPEGLDGVFMIYEPREAQGGRRLALGDMRRLSFAAVDVDEPAGETSYYVRVTQSDGQQAWSSPIWVSR